VGYEAKRTEHSGAKHGRGAYWSRKYDAQAREQKNPPAQCQERVSTTASPGAVDWIWKKKTKQLGINKSRFMPDPK